MRIGSLFSGAGGLDMAVEEVWSEFARAIAALRPRMVVIENVRNLLSVSANRDVESRADALGDSGSKSVLRGLGAVLGDLSDLGYDAQWATVSAASVGAPHRRERVFILAVDAHSSGECGADVAGGGDSAGQHALTVPGAGDRDRPRGVAAGVPELGGTAPELAAVELLPTPAASRSGNNQSASPGAAVRPSLDSITDLLPTPTARLGHPNGRGASHPDRRKELCSKRGGELDEVACHLLPTPNASDGSGGGQHPDQRDGHSRQLIDYALLHGTSRWGKYEPAIRRWESLTRPAPSPTEPNTRGNPRLAPAFPEWMLGWPDGWVTQVPGISRNDQLRIIGNGVCPQQATAALSWLLRIAEVAS